MATHIDRGHVHNHLIFCAVNFIDYHKYNSNKKSYYQIRNASDRLCRENGLSIIKPGKEIEYTDKNNKRQSRAAKEHGRSYAEYATDKSGGSWKSKLKLTIDITIPLSKNFDDFLKRMEKSGYEIKQGKYVSFRALGQERFTRSKTLGDNYTAERIAERIQGKKHAVSVPKRDSKRVSLVVDIQNSIKVQQSKGYEHWAKIHNLKQVAKTVNFLTKNNILGYDDLKAKVDEVVAASEQVTNNLKAVEKCLFDTGLLIENVTTYQQTKPIFDGYRAAKNKGQYRPENESALILHETAANALKALGVSGTNHNMVVLQAEYTQLQSQNEKLYTEYINLKKQVKEYDVIKQNIDSILKRKPDKSKEKDIEM